LLTKALDQRFIIYRLLLNTDYAFQPFHGHHNKTKEANLLRLTAYKTCSYFQKKSLQLKIVVTFLVTGCSFFYSLLRKNLAFNSV